MKPTKEQFKEYVFIQYSGVTNMFDVKTVCDLSDTGLTKDICIYIMRHYNDLLKEYNIDFSDEPDVDDIPYEGVI